LRFRCLLSVFVATSVSILLTARNSPRLRAILDFDFGTYR
jgi:hypothetical protein